MVSRKTLKKIDFSPRFMVPCSLLAENIFRFFEVRTYPSIHHFGLDVSPLVMQSRKASFPFAARVRMREPCLQRYVSRMTRTENFLSQFFSKIFWKPLLSTFYGTLFIISRKYFFGFSKSALRTDPSIHHFGLEASPL